MRNWTWLRWAMAGVVGFGPLTFVTFSSASAADVREAGWRHPLRSNSSQGGCATCPSCEGYAGPAPSQGTPTPMPQSPDAPVEPNQPTSPETADASELPSFGNLALAEQGVGGGAGTMILGRADALNRFNLFDNMGAEPVRRVWMAFQALEGLNTNVVGNPALGRPNQNLYRFGFEHAFSDVSSFAVQGMYNVTDDTGAGIGALEDSWSNPQFMLKRVLYRDDIRTLSGTLGFTAEVGTSASTINESFSRIQPGLIAYRAIGDMSFLHAGVELNTPLADNATMSTDWVVSLGRWLYRHESLDGCGDGCCRPWIVGMTGQIELLGKHVMGDATIRDGFFVVDTVPSQPSNGFPSTSVIRTFDFEEARHVIDMTVGTNILFCNDTAVGLGFSFPVSGNEVRRSEFIVSYNWFY